MRAWVDGTEDSSTGVTGSGTLSSTLNVNAMGVATVTPAHYPVVMIGVWPRTLSDLEIATLSANAAVLVEEDVLIPGLHLAYLAPGGAAPGIKSTQVDRSRTVGRGIGRGQ